MTWPTHKCSNGCSSCAEVLKQDYKFLIASTTSSAHNGANVVKLFSDIDRSIITLLRDVRLHETAWHAHWSHAPLLSRYAVDKSERDRLSEANVPIGLLNYSGLRIPRKILFDNTLYVLCDGQSKLDKFGLHKGPLPLFFQDYSKVTHHGYQDLSAVVPGGWDIRHDNNGNVVITPYW